MSLRNFQPMYLHNVFEQIEFFIPRQQLAFSCDFRKRSGKAICIRNPVFCFQFRCLSSESNIYIDLIL